MVNDWKEVWEIIERATILPKTKYKISQIRKLQERFFLGEVVRIEKEIKKCALLGKISECDYLEGQLFYVKELAGVEQKK